MKVYILKGLEYYKKNQLDNSLFFNKDKKKKFKYIKINISNIYKKK